MHVVPVFLVCAGAIAAASITDEADTSAKSDSSQVAANTTVRGVVFHDKNTNGLHDKGEPGLKGILVSNSREVVKTDASGRYELPVYDNMAVFVTKPAGYTPPLDSTNIPRFSYIHLPAGSPPEIKDYQGISPTGPLPETIDFPLIRTDGKKKFRAIITGDTQVYTDREIDYLRDSFVREAAGIDASCVITMGDNLGDDLSLYPRYLRVMSAIGQPVWLVPGNHDMNFDAANAMHAFDTFKRVFGPTYYSFEYGDVHFVVLNNVLYPSPRNTKKKSYHGEVDSVQMRWLAADLDNVSKKKLVVLCMHIPIVSFTDRKSPMNMLENRKELYALLKDRPVVALAGHTHTLEHILPGDREESWGQASPIPQIIVGAACGSWWSGDLDTYGVPLAYQRLGAPRGFMIFDFDGPRYVDRYKATGKSFNTQMHVGFKTPAFDAWYDTLTAWMSTEAKSRPEQPPVTIHDLPAPNIVTTSESGATRAVANIWNGSRETQVTFVFDDTTKLAGTRTTDLADPFALRQQAYVFRYAAGFQMFQDARLGPAPPQPLGRWLHTRESPHVWTCDFPANLSPGVHTLEVRANDRYGRVASELLVFELID